MDNQRLCSILLDLQHNLSDDDRERLHFYLKNEVPRTVGDDTTLSGTLKLMQSLFDQDKISDKDFSLLIDAFKKIGCSNAVEILEEHQRRMLSGDVRGSVQSVASTMPPNIQEFLYDHEHDQISMGKANHSNNDNTFDANHTIINQRTYSSSSRKWSSCIRLLTNRSFLFPFLLFLLTLGTLIGVCVWIGRHNRVNHSEHILQTKENDFGRNQSSADQTISDLRKQLSDEQELVRQSKHKIMQLSKQLNFTPADSKKNTSLIRAGQQFGGDGGNHFDDSLLSTFTIFHYLSGIIIFDIENLNSCQFIYRSFQDNQTRIESTVYGSYMGKVNRTREYHLDKDERIAKVQVQSYGIRPSDRDKPSSASRMVTSVKFITTKGQSIPSDFNLTSGDVETESFPGYTLGYVTGKAASKIHQLQFFWYRTGR